MSWKEELSAFFDGIELFPPTREEDLEALEQEFNLKLPEDLRTLYTETNGFLAKFDANICWSITNNDDNTDLATENLYIKSNETFPEDFDLNQVLFFGDDGADIFWGYKLDNGSVSDTLVAWNRAKNSVREYQMPLLNFFRMVAES